MRDDPHAGPAQATEAHDAIGCVQPDACTAQGRAGAVSGVAPCVQMIEREPQVAPVVRDETVHAQIGAFKRGGQDAQ
ncbi:MAG: hypothetical protein L6Q69_21660 [Zoogloea sp.]|nr:hypothetical protein [Zoogloea sp.]